jgi:hypothetical protein
MGNPLPPGNSAPSIKWGTEQRLEFIEFRLFWEGGINRADIIDRFGVSVPQAANDLKLYRDLAATNIVYDATEKRYVASPEFSPRFLKPNADRYLLQLKGIADGIIGPQDTWIAHSPEIDVLPNLARRVDPQILKTFLKAVHANRSVSIHYQSMSPHRTEPVWRQVTPHAFGFDGLRWHARAFCHIESKFKDFILSRCLGIREGGAPGAQPYEDKKWFSFFDVILEPNPALSEGQRKAVAMDFSMKDGYLRVPVRCALLYYFNKRLRLDVAEFIDRPQETPIIVVNQKEFKEALIDASA